jgi:hypothetical protein
MYVGYWKSAANYSKGKTQDVPGSDGIDSEHTGNTVGLKAGALG